ncbi:NAD(P)/FAD-dependent oxidoreductase [Tomitella biformata]|uniref:NAD(P)/FAD-dependent oxidoreductase n=1 Tax=Tomitella biformata TaxID=630403 RepID=UPI000466F5B8|nr:FAD-dependent oxidoreductase [Tomitella biformata]
MAENQNPGVVIVGGGLAGAKTAEALREQGFTGAVTLIGGERHLPYERPPLSKEHLAGAKQLPDFTVHDADWYREHSIDLRLGVRATAIETLARRVTLDDGQALDYSALVLATGSSSRRPPIPGSDAEGVHYLRTIEESDAVLAALTDGARLAVVGGGWIGLEVAASARGRGVEVTVVEASVLPLLAAMGPELAQVFADLHRQHGVDLRLDAKVAAITVAGGRATGLQLADGTLIEADAVLVAVGAAANIELAQDAGLTLAAGGIEVDAGLRTSAPDVYAVGDIAAAAHPLFGTRIRTEHWANALNQPAVAAANILGGAAEYANLPYFFTDQYDLGMEYSGHSAGYTQVVLRGDAAAREFIAFWLDENHRVLAGMNVNIWDSTDDIKALISARKPVDPQRLADVSVPLGEQL